MMNIFEFKKQHPTRTPYVIRLLRSNPPYKHRDSNERKHVYVNNYSNGEEFISDLKLVGTDLGIVLVYTREQAQLKVIELTNNGDYHKFNIYKIQFKPENYKHTSLGFLKALTGVSYGGAVTAPVDIPQPPMTKVCKSVTIVKLSALLPKAPSLRYKVHTVDYVAKSVTIINKDTGKYINAKSDHYDTFLPEISFYIAILKDVYGIEYIQNFYKDLQYARSGINELKHIFAGMVYNLYSPMFDTYEHFIRWTERGLAKGLARQNEIFKKKSEQKKQKENKNTSDVIKDTTSLAKLGRDEVFKAFNNKTVKITAAEGARLLDMSLSAFYKHAKAYKLKLN